MAVNTAKIKRVVIKIGTSTVTRSTGGLDEPQLKSLAGQLAALIKTGKELIVVTSGAIAAGVEKLKLGERPKQIPRLQAAASVGQGLLIGEYARYLEPFGIPVGQVLLTQADFIHREQYLNAKNAIETLLELGVMPVINENDATAVEEIRFGDNDVIAALVACFIEADLLVLLSDVDGVFRLNKNGEQELAEEISAIDRELERETEGSTSKFASGGMVSKVRAARIVTMSGIDMVIANGRRESILKDIFKGDFTGTHFTAQLQRLTSKKHWIAYVLPSRGCLTVDGGAREALVDRKKSLLPAGIKAVTGDFNPGDAVEIATETGEVFAKGISNFSAAEVEKIKGKRSCDFSGVLDDYACEEVVHRDSLVIL